MDKEKRHPETQTKERDADCYRAYMETIDELRNSNPELIGELSETTIAKLAVDKPPKKFYITHTYFLRCVRAHQKEKAQNCPSRR